MSNLKNQIEDLAAEFAQGVLAAIRSASLEEILEKGASPAATAKGGTRRGAPATTPAPKRARGGRLPRRSDEEIGAVGDKIIELLKGHAEGLRAEQIREELGLEAKELPRPLKELVANRKVKTKGQKRATTYFAR
ncbi:hypothetical protein LZC95_48300 [Pendulispora brunnea]|uniref:DNA-binding protein n=1 Tax=Pendulispora brunnea TaxID=2905690 RepID=A0ABZ2KCX3_9BACT